MNRAPDASTADPLKLRQRPDGRWFTIDPAGDERAEVVLQYNDGVTPAPINLAAAGQLCVALDRLRGEVAALRAEFGAKRASLEAGAFMRELPVAPPPRASMSADSERTTFINGALLGATAATVVFVLISFGGGS